MNLAQFTNLRSGTVSRQSTGYLAFIPKSLPPDPPLQLDAEALSLLTEASLSLGRLNGLASVIRDPDLFVYLYVRKEALLSSQIEGTQCSLEDVLEEPEAKKGNADIEEVSNYVSAMNQGLEKLKEIPISTRLIKEMHAVLMEGVRGSNKAPGSFRGTQNWIGTPGATLEAAEFVPPPPQEVNEAMSALEKYIHSNDSLPPLIKAALVHAQFETIHPFLDGNGRLGRLLITFVLCSWGVMEKPLLYLSYFFKANRTEYYSRLMATRTKGDWENWIKFFLRGICEASKMANQAALDIYDLHKSDLAKIHRADSSPATNRVFEIFCRFPISTIPELQRNTSMNPVTLNRAVQALCDLNVLEKLGQNQRNRRFGYRKYMEILTRDTVRAAG